MHERVQIQLKELKTMSDSNENCKFFTYVQTVPFKCHVNCGNLSLTTNFDVKDYKLNH